MTIFLAIVMGPGFTFMLYALYQFWREEWRMRHDRSRRRGGIVTLVTSTSPLNDHTPHHATHASAAILEGKPAVASFTAAGKSSARAKVVAMYLKNRAAVIPSRTGRLAVKRVAKG
jgi:hypothetical protein